MKIFIIEDEPAIREELIQLLEKYGYQCSSSDDFLHIAETALVSEADLILLDINLPYQDGFQVCREIRQKSNLPIIVLTSRNSDFDELMSLNIGADDYISKPYNAQVLLARIQKLLARTYEVQDNVVLTHKGLTLNLLKAEISYRGQRKALTKNEMGILRLLMVNKGNIIPRDAIIDELWQSEQFIDENTLNVNIVRLRKTLAEIGLPDYLETKRGLYYAGTTLLASYALSALAVGMGVRMMVASDWTATFRFTLLPLMICTPILIVFAILIPYVCFKNLEKQSIVERLRATD